MTTRAKKKTARPITELVAEFTYRDHAVRIMKHGENKFRYSFGEKPFEQNQFIRELYQPATRSSLGDYSSESAARRWAMNAVDLRVDASPRMTQIWEKDERNRAKAAKA